MKKIILTILVLGIGFCLYESYLRFELRNKMYNDPGSYNMLFYSDPILKTPNKNISFRYYTKDSTLVASADFHMNNFGFISHKDYRYERQNDKKEFRIVVIGGEQTASTVATRSWPDILEDELNRKFNTLGYEFKVFNIGWPDAGPAQYVQYWEEFGKKFNPDLIVVNYVETDFHRGPQGGTNVIKNVAATPAKTTPAKTAPISYSSIEYKVGETENDIAKTGCAKRGEAPITSYRDPRAIPSRPFSFFASVQLMNDLQKVSLLQKRVVEDFIEGGMPGFGYLATSKGYNIAQKRNFDPIPSDPTAQENAVKFLHKNFDTLLQNHQKILFTHNFNYPEVANKMPFEYTAKLMQMDSRLPIVDMRKYVPDNISSEELQSWYIYPQMSEKWSNKGHAVYAEFMVKLISAELGLDSSKE